MKRLFSYTGFFFTILISTFLFTQLVYFLALAVDTNRTPPWLVNSNYKMNNITRAEFDQFSNNIENSYSLNVTIGNEAFEIDGSDIGLTVDRNYVYKNYFGNNNGSVLTNLIAIINLYFDSEADIPISYNQQALEIQIKEIEDKFMQEVRNSNLIINTDTKEFQYQSPQKGRFFNEYELKIAVNNSVENLEPYTLVSAEITKPKTEAPSVAKLAYELNNLWNNDLTLNIDQSNIYLSKDTLAEWSRLEVYGYKSNVINVNTEKEIKYKWLISDDDKIKSSISKFKETLDHPVKEGIIVKGEDKNFIVEHSQRGITIDEEKTLGNITSFITSGGQKNLNIAFKETIPETDTQQLVDNKNYIDTTQMIGQGISRFPNNDWARVTNIKAGMTRLDGYIIEPNSEFALYDGLDGINPKDGYVIGHALQGGLVVNSFAGGVCQIATTVFRSALESGFEITERHNHSMWLSKYTYPYEKNVVDAAIFYTKSSREDVKFKNDTPYYVVVKTELKLNEQDNNYYAYVKLYSSPEFVKREVELKDMKLWNYTYNNNVIEIEDESLASGQKILMQNPVPGVSGSFKRVVKEKGKVIMEDEFFSKYHPYAAAYKVGP